MRKLALLLAAALIVSVPLGAIITTDSYAATKKKAKRAKVAKVAAAPKDTGPRPPFQDMWRALDDLGAQFAAAAKK